MVDQAGWSFPLGATVFTDGVNFSVFSRQASRVELLLFEHSASPYPARVIELDARTHRTYHYWHVLCPASVPDRSTHFGRADLFLQSTASALIQTRFC
jgi:pullulanase/glycogen debranching enzyme